MNGVEYLRSPQKRQLDVLGSFALLGAFGPAIIATGAVCAANAGRFNPVLVQERSRGIERSIGTYKFQTLTKQVGGIATNAVLGTFDPRSNRLGQTIRQLGLDESPQLFNVIKGEMSLVGPRPMLASELKYYDDADPVLFDEWYPNYVACKPGLTGKSQLLRHHYRGFDPQLRAETMRMDMEYFETADLQTDVSIIARTPLKIIQANIGVEDASHFKPAV